MSTRYWIPNAPQSQLTVVPDTLPVSFIQQLSTASHQGDTLLRTIGDIQLKYLINSTGANPPPTGLLLNSYVNWGVWFDPTGVVASGSVPTANATPTPWWVARGQLYPDFSTEPTPVGQTQACVFSNRTPIDSEAQRKSNPTANGRMWLSMQWQCNTGYFGDPTVQLEIGYKANFSALYLHH